MPCNVPPNPARNLAARMGRWSASHRKTRDLRLARVRDRGDRDRHGGRSEDDRSAEQQRRPGPPGDQILKQGGFTQSDPLTEIVVVQSKHQTVADPAFRAAWPTCADGRAVSQRPQPALAASASEPRPGLARRAHRARRMGHERDAQGRREADRPAHRARSRRSARRTPVLRRRGRRGQLRQGADQAVQLAARAGRDALGAAHAADPGARVRLAAGGLDPADARPAVRDRDGRADRHRQPPHADGPERAGGRDARRPRRRASTTRCSTCAASARSARPAAASAPRSRRPRRPPDARCWSPAPP